MERTGDGVQRLADLGPQLREKVEKVAAQSAWAAGAKAAGKGALYGLALGTLGWCADWAIGPVWSRTVFVGWNGSFPPAMGIVSAVLFAALGWGATFFLLVIGFRRMLAGKWSLGDENTPRTVWWLRWLMRTVVIYVGIAAIFISLDVVPWAWHGLPAREQREWRELLEMTTGASFMGAVFMSTIMMILELIAWLYRRIKPYLMTLAWFRRLHVLASFGESVLFCGLFAAPILLGVHYAVRPFGFGSPWTAGTAGAMLGLSVLWGLWIERGPWTTSSPEQDGRDDALKLLIKDHARFVNLNMAPETSVSGEAPTGFPYVAWRESADSRLGLGRPRYCCISEIGGQLWFAYCEPLGARRPTGGFAVLLLVGIGVVIARLVDFFVLGHDMSGGPYSFKLPPALPIVSAFLMGPLLGAAAAGMWYVVALLLRWHSDKFIGDARLYVAPYAMLENFNRLAAADAGAMVNGEPARSGYGLEAVFADGEAWALTGNAWSHRSISELHRYMTQVFRIPRDERLAEYAEKQKWQGKPAQAGANTPARSTTASDPRQHEDRNEARVHQIDSDIPESL